jgi:hypothetical protein
MAKKSKRMRKRKLSAREFATEFTKIVGGYIAGLPVAEQTKRIRAAKRVVTARFRAASPKAPVISDTPRNARAVQTRE